ncbi:MAG: sugar phosphate isomerase/epimerase [Deltaproteobacteria bacterium]|nr:sugar phosphate isomerase/epimerase [Deltaproteobacteria bacterium]
MRRLLNFSTHSGELALFNDDWTRAADFLREWEFDGFELYPVGDYAFTRIPSEMIHGLHLRFFVILRQLWQGKTGQLLEIFGSRDTVRRFYGGTDRQCLIDAYAQQFELAERLGCNYVVFHPVHCELQYIFDWKFPWHWRETLDLCSELLNESLARSRFSGWLLFENLWWPGSFRLEDQEEYDYLRTRVNYRRCGIVLDTGHLLNSAGGFANETDAVNFLLTRVKQLGSLRREIHTVHLNCNLSGNYIRTTMANPPSISGDFWTQLQTAREHVAQIDPHEPFTDPAISKLFDLIAPEQVVFEFTFRGMSQWQAKISRQKQALEKHLWR